MNVANLVSDLAWQLGHNGEQEAVVKIIDDSGNIISAYPIERVDNGSSDIFCKVSRVTNPN